MNLQNLKTSSHERAVLENKAITSICVCYYYDLADALDVTTTEELEKIISESSSNCQNCTDYPNHC